ncbi:PTS mannitol transporter subunit IICBA [Lactobacillus sp. ESL0785]|uniref:PTS mannitol transporter subunit IICBA n=1 Tax=Lactobacillus sp. ESL0785 TaxID=2983232 RepID=UPI0023F78EC7|nr:PTS mannitol transporter subunit IICBA [Lactobacillus sp. ESL0785]WEV71614.1 PTS mannitol transporter subunit IICBA [Lactobacillus sp. ESL0785]
MSQENTKSSVKVKIQKFGTFLSGMIMPNIGAIIAWGLTAAIFMTPNGWFPNAKINNLIKPMLNYLLPLLIGYTGGKMIDEERGAVIGSVATIGVIVGTDQPMFLGAMIMGPLSAWLMKKLDNLFRDKIKSGFEMIYDNFSLGILGLMLAIFAYFIVNPIMVTGSRWASTAVDAIIRVHLLPLANIIIEPAKVLFLNNAIGNGILVPLGIQQAAQAGKSVLFMMESNPGPGLGILLAFMLFGKGSSKSSAPGAAIIEFFGGIHEIYFPYILMKPILIIAAIAGGVSGTFLFSLLGGGLKAAASPGSIIAMLLVSAKGTYFGNIVGVLGSTLVSFAISAIILKNDKSVDGDLAAKQAQMQSMKAVSKGQEIAPSESAANSVQSYANVKKVIFACDAGMGSSAMGASLLRDKFKKAGINIAVTNMAIRNLHDDSNLLVVSQNQLADRSLQKTPSAMHVSVDNFLNSPKYDEIVANLTTLNQVNDDNSKNISLNKTNTLADINFDEIKEVNFIRHDQHIGTSTMATNLFTNKLKEANKSVLVKAVRIEDLKDDPSHLVIVTPEAENNLKLRYSKIQVIVEDDLLQGKELAEIVAKLN